MPTNPPSRLLRVAIFICLWAVCGFALYATYQTDVCPPDVKHREALWSGLLTPLTLFGNAGAGISHPPLRQVAGIYFLVAYCIANLTLLRSHTFTQLVTSSIALALLSGLGCWCTIYSYAHAGG